MLAQATVRLHNPRLGVAGSLPIGGLGCDEEVGGAGYGDRTRLTGLGSQDITTMLSPRSRYFIRLKAYGSRLKPTRQPGYKP